jgi:hypothetical protein
VAHVAGLASGFLLGLVARRSERLKRVWVQAAAGASGVGLVVASWLPAFLGRG